MQWEQALPITRTSWPQRDGSPPNFRSTQDNSENLGVLANFTALSTQRLSPASHTVDARSTTSHRRGGRHSDAEHLLNRLRRYVPIVAQSSVADSCHTHAQRMPSTSVLPQRVIWEDGLAASPEALRSFDPASLCLANPPSSFVPSLSMAACLPPPAEGTLWDNPVSCLEIMADGRTEDFFAYDESERSDADLLAEKALV